MLVPETPTKQNLKIMMKSASGSDDPTPSIISLCSRTCAGPGHDVQNFLTEASPETSGNWRLEEPSAA